MFYIGSQLDILEFILSELTIQTLIMLQRRFIVHLTQYLAELAEVVLKKLSSSRKVTGPI